MQIWSFSRNRLLTALCSSCLACSAECKTVSFQSQQSKLNSFFFFPVKGARHFTANKIPMTHHIAPHRYFTFTTESPWILHHCPAKCVNPTRWGWEGGGGVLLMCQWGGEMSQLLWLLHPKQTSSLWWLNHMLTSWQGGGVRPLPLSETHCAPSSEWTATKKNILDTNLWPPKSPRDKYFPCINHSH